MALDPFTIPSLPWHVISGADLLAMLRRVEAGETADMVYAEEYVNADRERVPARAPFTADDIPESTVLTAFEAWSAMESTNDTSDRCMARAIAAALNEGTPHAD